MKKIISLFILISFINMKAQNEFITIWKPNNDFAIIAGSQQYSNDKQIYFPGIGTNYKIDWEEVDNPSHKGTLNNVTSTLGNPILIDFGTSSANNPLYKLKVSDGSGNFQRLAFQTFPSTMYSFGDKYKVIEVKQWGNIKWTNMESAFYSCQNMDVTATDVPDLSNVRNFRAMFSGCSNLIGNPSFAQWDTSNIISMQSMFRFTLKFNQNINSWNTAKVTDMSFMFADSSFNQPIGNWNTSNVTTMAAMFISAVSFNQNIGNWNTSKVTDMSDMFNYAKVFNQPIGNWNTSKVVTMESMFDNATNFNQPIGNWNTSSLVNMKRLFYYAKFFNQSIGNWNTSNVRNMTEMFFRAETFNQNIGNWNTSKVGDMSAMFYVAKNFNQNIGSWNVAQVASMYSMFTYAENFNQNIGNWDIKNMTDGKDMLYLSGITCNNYDKILIGWANNPNTRSGIRLASKLKYSSDQAVAARTVLINKNWNLSNDIYDPSCVLSTDNWENESKIEVYPNPTTNYFFVKNGKENDHVFLYDISGKMIKQEKLNKLKQIDIKTLQKGTYLGKINNSNFKIIKN